MVLTHQIMMRRSGFLLFSIFYQVFDYPNKPIEVNLEIDNEIPLPNT